MTELKRIGVFGGTFDPIHNAHIAIARAAMKAASLDVVLFVVSAVPPHKREGVNATPEQRYSMVAEALRDESDLEVSDLELNRAGPSYTSMTLDTLSEVYPSAKLYLILGLDSLIDMPTWHEPEAILSRAHILAVSRPDESRKIPETLSGNYDLVPFEESSISSTEIRRRIGAGESLVGLVPQAIISILEDGTIYG
jgi:nicotinate-nucleotide adenylyltransferase